MGSSILKGDQEHDLYCVWSSIVGGPTVIGTREEIVQDLAEHEWDEVTGQCRAQSSYHTGARIDVADQLGTSLKNRPSYGRWDDDFLMYGQEGLLPRPRLYDFLMVLLGDRETVGGWWDTSKLPEAAKAMLEPYEDE